LVRRSYKRVDHLWDGSYKRVGLWWEGPYKRIGLWWEGPYKRIGLWWGKANPLIRSLPLKVNPLIRQDFRCTELNTTKLCPSKEATSLIRLLFHCGRSGLIRVGLQKEWPYKIGTTGMAL
jgi:hypothetical protein